MITHHVVALFPLCGDTLESIHEDEVFEGTDEMKNTPDRRLFLYLFYRCILSISHSCLLSSHGLLRCI